MYMRKFAFHGSPFLSANVECPLRTLFQFQDIWWQANSGITAQRMKFSFKDFLSKCFLRKLRIWSHLLTLNGKLHFFCSGFSIWSKKCFIGITKWKYIFTHIAVFFEDAALEGLKSFLINIFCIYDNIIRTISYHIDNIIWYFS